MTFFSPPSGGIPMNSTNGKQENVEVINAASKPRIFRISLRIPITLVATAVLSSLLPPVLAQAPVNDVVSWPSGLLLLAAILYAALGTSPDLLWEIEPVTGFFLFAGLPKISFATMRRADWVANACHYIPGIQSASGRSNFWVRSSEVTTEARARALEKVLSQLRCTTYRPPGTPLDEKTWSITPSGMLTKPTLVPSSPSYEIKCPLPIARDFLLFAAIEYHTFREWEVQIYSKGSMVFSTNNMTPYAIIDVYSEEEAIQVVAAQMVRRPHSQSPLRGMAKKTGEGKHGPYALDLDTIDRNIPICAIDFHSYAPEGHKVSATLSELGRSYFRIVRYLNDNAPRDIGLSGQIARIQVKQTLWIAILGGAILDSGRLTIQNLPGDWWSQDFSTTDAYLERINAIVDLLEPYAGTETQFNDLAFSGGINRRSAIPFFIAGLIGQIIVCYFLTVGTSAGIWTSLALANSLYAGRLTDWHSIYYSKRPPATGNDQPGMKLYLPGSPSKEVMVIATFDRSAPREGPGLRSGFFLSIFGLAAAILGAIFQEQTRATLSFSPITPTPPWVVYTSVFLCIGTTILILSMLIVQQLYAKTWANDSEFPTRMMAYSTLPSSIVVCALAVAFRLKGWDHLWPVLDAITFLSGFPLAMIENGRFFGVDENVLHLVLLNRWMMGAVGSSLGSSVHSR
ncbi:hypothetical protein M413DRAFT_445765 [Hebeloma cylindrosporum]|uniref:Uncharacterized protein n=1 Tax=Hebeloma cylindrosporum TaxID=76867 RepID=A0A0C3C9U3_HEBCY|nr:hypothetical protein M413DRAFT_445765 [Hebeloma cylindrosporum h7]